MIVILSLAACHVSGVTGNEETWRMCVSDTDSILGFALGAMFVREAFHGNSKTKVGTLG